nr:unnamed protein product [Callosobruchus analis]
MAKANTYNIIETKDPIQLSRQICCDETTEDCINRTCSICQNKTIKISNLEKDDKVSYERWYSKRVEIEIKGKKKLCQRTVKESVDCSKLVMVEHLNSSLVKFMAHSRNIVHQYNSKIIVVNMHLSYNLPTLEDPRQVTLHTAVMYYLSTDTNGEQSVKPLSLCTFSDNMRHDPAAICAHLEPVIEEALEIVPNLRTAFFLSDGPSTQYKKNVFSDG